MTEPAELVPRFLEHLTLPADKPARPFVVGIIGNIGSGKSTVARKLLSHFPGAVHVQADSARYLLKEAGLPWGDNVGQLIAAVMQALLERGYGVILDGNTAESGERDRLAHLASPLGAPVAYVRVRCETEICTLRTQQKYDDASWVSTFDDFRVNTTEKMVQNVRERAKLHHNLDSKDIVGLAAEVDANIAPEELDRQIPDVVSRVRERLE